MRYTGEGVFRLLPILMNIFHVFYAVLSKSAYEGAMTTIYCAIDDDVPKYNGYYFRFSIIKYFLNSKKFVDLQFRFLTKKSDCKISKPYKNGLNREDAAKLWDISAKMVNL